MNENMLQSRNFDEGLRQLAARHGLTLCGPLEVNEIGLDFRVVAAQDERGLDWILRLPRRSDMAGQIAKEAKVLDLVRLHVPFSVPEWKILSPELVAYPKLTDPTAIAVDSRTHELTWNIQASSTSFSATLGCAIAALHAIPALPAIEAGLRVQTPENARLQLERDIETVKSRFLIDKHLERRWRDWIDNDRIWPAQVVVVHGDLYAGHVLVNQEEELTGIIDWSEAEINDPAIDFSAHLMLFGEAGLSTALDYYERAGGIVWPGMRAHIAERLAVSPIRLALFALRTGNEAHVKPAQAQLLNQG